MSAALVLAVAAFTLAGVPARAHDGNVYYPNKWNLSESGSQIKWAFEDSFPNTNFKDRILDATQEWNALNGNRQWNKVDNYANYSVHDCGETPFEQNGMHWGSIDGATGTVARTYWCLDLHVPQHLWQQDIKFDSAEDWYTGTGNVPSGKIDAQATATHELGHAMGFYGPYNAGHFQATDQLCNGTDPINTMCPFILPGSNIMRSLEEHDKHTFNNAY